MLYKTKLCLNSYIQLNSHGQSEQNAFLATGQCSLKTLYNQSKNLCTAVFTETPQFNYQGEVVVDI